MFGTITKLYQALKIGNELSDVSKWKRGQWLTNAVGGLVALVLESIKLWKPELAAYLPEGVAENATEIIVGVLVVINLYLTPATTKKVGVK
jgi:hypothetical protein